ncbi:glycosyltransferase family 4 protein [[Pseudomonas] boreopolis]|uniref:glycosyltransferase family 4 protein n=1 Tax=Xanthomonas boreopolis TaxID=86183 RepID=UPI003D9BDA1E
MKILLNLSMLGDKPTGLGVYSLSCARISSSLKSSFIGKVPEGIIPEEVVFSPASIGIGGGKWAAIKRQLWMRRLSFDSRYLVYSPTHHGLPNQKGQIITLHDMICLRFPRQHIPQYVFFKYLIPGLLRKCRAVFTVSETTKRDIVRTYGYPAENIFVVPNSVDATRFTSGEVNTQDPYLLMVGARYTHKNVDEVLRNAHLWESRYRLVVTSCSGKYRATLERLIDQLGIRERVDFRDYVSSDELLRLYQGCTALVYPSKWEGFGIPPLEALACGRPVIASDIEIHREVLGDAALYVALGDESAWRAAFAELQNNQRVAELIRLGQARVAHYSPQNSLAALKTSLLAVEPGLERV